MIFEHTATALEGGVNPLPRNIQGHARSVTKQVKIITANLSDTEAPCCVGGLPDTDVNASKLRISLNSNSSRGIIGDITRYGRFPEKNIFLDYAAFGRVWYGAK